MEEEIKKFAEISEIYSHLTEENKENLLKAAEELFRKQKDNTLLKNHTPKISP